VAESHSLRTKPFIRLRFVPPAVCAVAALLAAILPAAIAQAAPFYMGSDVSLLPFIEQQGGVFRQNGVITPAEKLLASHGDNLFRLRLFVNPDGTYSDTDGAIQNLSYDLSLAQRLQATGAKILLDLHYSDTWADPAHQTTPSAWSSDTFSQLKTDVYNYTANTITSFENAGVTPAIVQVGNETTDGMLWPDGQIAYSGSTATQDQSWANYGQLVNSAIAGVRAVQPASSPIQVAIHIDGGDKANDGPSFFYDLEHLGGVSDFDIMGLSFYPTATETGALTNLKNNLDSLAAANPGKHVMVLETNYAYETNTSGATGPGAQWAVSPAGQQQFITDVATTVASVPNGAGEGMVYWYPESIQVPNTYIYDGGTNALFDSSGNMLPAVNAFNLPEPASFTALSLPAVLALCRRRRLRAPGRGNKAG
jgi:arabinogalactan endo-1,4-beta-galactosidase